MRWEVRGGEVDGGEPALAHLLLDQGDGGGVQVPQDLGAVVAVAGLRGGDETQAEGDGEQGGDEEGGAGSAGGAGGGWLMEEPSVPGPRTVGEAGPRRPKHSRCGLGHPER